MRSTFIYLFFISVLLHLAFFTFISLTIEKKSTPVIISWLDILSSSDLVSRKKEDEDNYKFCVNSTFTSWFSEIKNENYFFRKNSIVLFKDYFSSLNQLPLFLSIKAMQEKNEKFPKSLAYPEYFLLSLEKPTFLKKETLNLKYRITTDKRERILFFIPQILDNDLVLLYTNAHLRHNFLFLKKRNLFWTEIKVVIK